MLTRTIPGARGGRRFDPLTGRGRTALTLPSLTGLRWMAAFLVFGVHLHLIAYFADGTLARSLKFVFGAGATGVSFFFILSGFVLTWANSRGCGSGWATFWWRRLARVYPAHLATALVVLLLFAVWQPDILPSVVPAAANLLLVHAWWPDPAFYQSLNSVSWTLACEAFFYAVFPLLVAGLTRRGRRAACLVAGGSVATLWVGPIAALWVASPDWVVWFFHWTPPGRLPEFVLGMALARLVALGAWPRRLDRLTTYPVAATVLVAGYLAASHVPAPYKYAGCTAVGFGLLIVAAARADLRGAPSLWRRPAVVRLGELSYAFYLVHMIVVFVLALVVGRHPRLGAGQGILLTMATLLMSLASAWVLHELVERPARTLLLGTVPGRRPEVPRQRTRQTSA
ncbi:acyltransferase [Micromonospora sp. NPDC048999]|uniref:acyltransferase family protein n=1 Tax=Micromonospora sp. NPDC048999 TaxID=3155391 RepID=UPI0034016789